MEAVRSFTSNNRGTLMNMVYVVAFLVVLYYLYKFLIADNELETICLSSSAPANVPGASAIKAQQGVLTGGLYTLSFWMYISNWDYRSGQAKSVIQIVDKTVTDYSLLTTILYPNEPKMMVRVHTMTQATGGDVDYTMNTNATNLLNGAAGATMFTPSINMPICDLQDIDLQRWIHVAISVNGRIVDVYYDGKLNRSCVLSDLPVAPTPGNQAIVWGNNGGYGGSISNITFYQYALTPDRIYAIYQGGPQASSNGLLGYLADMLGIKLTYAGQGDVQKQINM